jgi:hypothetical protein
MGRCLDNSVTINLRKLARGKGPADELTWFRALLDRTLNELELIEAREVVNRRISCLEIIPNLEVIYSRFVVDDPAVNIDKREFYIRICCIEHFVQDKINRAELPERLSDDDLASLLEFALTEYSFALYPVLRDEDTIFMDRIWSSTMSRSKAKLGDDQDREAPEKISARRLTSIILSAFRNSVKNERTEYRKKQASAYAAVHCERARERIASNQPRPKDDDVAVVFRESIVGHKNESWFDLYNFSLPSIPESRPPALDDAVSTDLEGLRSSGLITERLVPDLTVRSLAAMKTAHRRVYVKCLEHPRMKIGKIQKEFFPEENPGAIRARKSRGQGEFLALMAQEVNRLIEKLQGDEDRRNYLDVLEAMNDRIAAYNNLRALRSKKMSRSRRPQHAR